MFRRSVSDKSGFILKRCAFGLGVLALSAPLFAQTPPAPIPVTIGAGLQTSFVHTDPRGGTSVDQFVINSARIYLNGTAAPNIKFTFNTEYDGSNNKVGIMDAVARYEPSGKFNIWMGRFLPPSDRANLYGPYYSHEWATYQDGIQDGYPFVATGRDNGIAYWGDYGKVKVSAGAFDGASSTGNPKVLMAGRVQVDFWDKESGYYLNGTYYGGKNILAIGAAFQSQSSNTSGTADFLLEKKLPNEGVVTVESEFSYYDKLGGYNSRYGLSRGDYVLASYLFPKPIGAGKIEILGKFAEASFARGITPFDIYYKQKTTEANLNYIIKEFNARVMTFYKNTKFTAVNNNFWQVGLGLQIQM
jgi:hypothetical protein